MIFTVMIWLNIVTSWIPQNLWNSVLPTLPFSWYCNLCGLFDRAGIETAQQLSQSIVLTLLFSVFRDETKPIKKDKLVLKCFSQLQLFKLHQYYCLVSIHSDHRLYWGHCCEKLKYKLDDCGRQNGPENLLHLNDKITLSMASK